MGTTMKYEPQIKSFSELSNEAKIYFLLLLAKEAVIVVRSISVEPNSADAAAAAARVVCEFQGFVAAEVRALFCGDEHYPDDVLVTLAIEYLSKDELRNEGSNVWQQAVAGLKRAHLPKLISSP